MLEPLMQALMAQLVPKAFLTLTMDLNKVDIEYKGRYFVVDVLKDGYGLSSLPAAMFSELPDEHYALPEQLARRILGLVASGESTKERPYGSEARWPHHDIGVSCAG